MTTHADQDAELERLRNMPIRSEEIGYSPSEMVACAKCGKANAPDRAACLYCGTAFEGVVATKLNLRELEAWEKGFNVVVLDTAGANADGAAAKLGAMTRRDAEIFKVILRSGRTLPLARLETLEQANTVAERLSGFGIKTRIIDDESLHAESRPVRLGSIRFDGNGLRLQPFYSGDDDVIERGDLAVIVVGASFEERTESLEKRTRRSSKTLSESRLSSDEPVIDLYSGRDPFGWRIPASGFDFSCLGSEKSLLAVENMRTLVSKLAEFSPGVKVVGDYVDVRSLLDHCWPNEATKDSQRRGISGKKVASVVLTSNTTQWNKYSRLQWHLL